MNKHHIKFKLGNRLEISIVNVDTPTSIPAQEFDVAVFPQGLAFTSEQRKKIEETSYCGYSLFFHEKANYYEFFGINATWLPELLMKLHNLPENKA